MAEWACADTMGMMVPMGALCDVGGVNPDVRGGGSAWSFRGNSELRIEVNSWNVVADFDEYIWDFLPDEFEVCVHDEGFGGDGSLHGLGEPSWRGPRDFPWLLPEWLRGLLWGFERIETSEEQGFPVLKLSAVSEVLGLNGRVDGEHSVSSSQS